jgi:hypothetical protein
MSSGALRCRQQQQQRQRRRLQPSHLRVPQCTQPSISQTASWQAACSYTWPNQPLLQLRLVRCFMNRISIN